MDKDNISVDPKIQVLSKEQIERVHNYSIQILENIGIKVESKRARDFFANTGFGRFDQLSKSNRWVQFTS